jgi:hypothetical protein
LHHPIRRIGKEAEVSQATRKWIAEKVKLLSESDVLPFHEIIDVFMVKSALATAGVRFNECIYTPMVTVCRFLSQVLDPDHSCVLNQLEMECPGFRVS